MNKRLEKIINSITPINSDLLNQAQTRLDQLTKPQGSLGQLEEIAKRLFAIYGNLEHRIESKAVFVLAGDHGVAEEGVSAFPQEVTRQMLANFVEGGAAISVLARNLGARLFVADMGVKGDFSHPDLIALKVRPGTRNFLYEDAMTPEETERAILSGYDLLKRHHEEFQFDLVALGEMGIGNTTPASAIISVLTNHPPSEVTGRGTGLTDQSLASKIRILDHTLASRKPDFRHPLEVLAKLGGYEIAGLAGIYLACAELQIPALVDGLISGSAALVAAKLAPYARDYFFATHQSVEPGHQVTLNEMNLKPLISANLRLGEGSGAAIAFPLFESAWNLFTQMATFDSAGVSQKE